MSGEASTQGTGGVQAVEPALAISLAVGFCMKNLVAGLSQF